MVNEHVFQLKQKKTFAQEHGLILGGLGGHTNKAAVTSRENTIYVPTTCILLLPLFANQRHIMSSIF